MDPIIKKIVSELQQNTNPCVNYAVLDCMGYISDVKGGRLQAIYNDILMPVMLQTLSDQSQPQRVISHCAACLRNYFDHMDKNQLLMFITPLVNLFCQQISSEDSSASLKENAASALSIIAEKVEDQFGPFFKQTLSVLMDALGN